MERPPKMAMPDGVFSYDCIRLCLSQAPTFFTARDLGRFRLIHSTWRDCISDPSFLTDHYRRTVAAVSSGACAPSILLTIRSNHHSIFVRTLSLSQERLYRREFFFGTDVSISEAYAVAVSGVSLFRVDRKDDWFLFLGNTLTGRGILLPAPLLRGTQSPLLPEEGPPPGWEDTEWIDGPDTDEDEGALLHMEYDQFLEERGDILEAFHDAGVEIEEFLVDEGDEDDEDDPDDAIEVVVNTPDDDDDAAMDLYEALVAECHAAAISGDAMEVDAPDADADLKINIPATPEDSNRSVYGIGFTGVIVVVRLYHVLTDGVTSAEIFQCQANGNPLPVNNWRQLGPLPDPHFVPSGMSIPIPPAGMNCLAWIGKMTSNANGIVLFGLEEEKFMYLPFPEDYTTVPLYSCRLSAHGDRFILSIRVDEVIRCFTLTPGLGLENAEWFESDHIILSAEFAEVEPSFFWENVLAFTHVENINEVNPYDGCDGEAVEMTEEKQQYFSVSNIDFLNLYPECLLLG